MKKFESIWSVLGLIFVFYPHSASFYSYFQIQYDYLFYSGCYFFVWICIIFRRKFLSGQNIYCPLRWLDSLYVLLILYLFAYSCRNIEDNGLIIFKLGVSSLGYYCFRNIPKEHFIWYIVSLLLAGVIQIIYSLYTQADYFVLSDKLCRIYGSFLNTSVWGNYLALLLLMSLGLIKWIKREFLFLLLLLSLFFVFLLWLSDSRTGWLVLLIGALYIIYYIYLCEKKPLVIKLHLFFVKLFLAAFISLLLSGLYLYKKDSGDGRLFIWRVSYDMIKDAPLCGYGINGFKQNYMLYQASFLKKHPMHKWRTLADDNSFAFNEYIKFVVEHGIIASILFFTLFLYILLKWTNSQDVRAILSKLILLGWGVIALFSYPFFVWQFVVILLFGLAGLGGGDLLSLPHSKNALAYKACYVGLISLVFIMLVGGALFGKKNLTLISQGKRLFVERKYTEAKNMFGRSFQHFPNYETAMLIGEACNELQQNDSAEIFWKLASEMIPNRVMPHYSLFKIYRTYDVDKAYFEAILIKKMSIKVHAPQLNVIFNDVNNFLSDY